MHSLGRIYPVSGFSKQFRDSFGNLPYVFDTGGDREARLEACRVCRSLAHNIFLQGGCVLWNPSTVDLLMRLS